MVLKQRRQVKSNIFFIYIFSLCACIYLIYISNIYVTYFVLPWNRLKWHLSWFGEIIPPNIRTDKVELVSKQVVLITSVQFSSVQSLSRVRLFVTPWITARQASLSITNSPSSLKLMSIESVMPSSHLILCCLLFLLPQSLPASESFLMSQLFTWGGQSMAIKINFYLTWINSQT